MAVYIPLALRHDALLIIGGSADLLGIAYLLALNRWEIENQISVSHYNNLPFSCAHLMDVSHVC